jgi:hypothetical protein
MHRIGFGLALVVACSSGSGDHDAPPPIDEGGSSSGGTRAQPATSGKANASGAAGESASQGGAADAGAADGGAGLVLEIGGAPVQAPPGVCDPQLELGADMAEDVGVGSVTLLSMTPDELSLAFTSGEGDSLLLHVTDRVSTASDFKEVGLTMPPGFEAKSGVALSSDGRKVILVMTDHSGFGELSRAARGQAFAGEPELTAFARLNALKPMSGHSLGWPVLASDGQSLYFVSYFGEGFVYQSHLGNGVFDTGTQIDPYTLGGDAGEYKLINGLSSDERAIFYFDQATQHAMALFRSRPNGPFYDPLDLGERQGVVPNAGCDRVYSSAAGKLVVQSRK